MDPGLKSRFVQPTMPAEAFEDYQPRKCGLCELYDQDQGALVQGDDQEEGGLVAGLQLPLES